MDDVVKYPKLIWELERPNYFTATTSDYYLRCGLRQGGKDAGTWSAIINDTSLTIGFGDFGYCFEDENHAKRALENAMREAIDAQILFAKRVLNTYTTQNPGVS